LIISDKDSRILHVNRGFTRLFGWQNEEVLRRPIGLLAPHLPPAFQKATTAHCVPDVRGAGRNCGRQKRSALLGQGHQQPDPGCAGCMDTVSMLTDITRSKMHEALQHRVLEALARERH
jgi:PAS domain-containing protein